VIPNYIKIDVEGAEQQVLLGGKSMLSTHRPKLFLAIHGKQQELACTRLLQSLGYAISEIEPNELFCH
jgi:hypothetical protein